jgi:hypothetical protein
MNMQMRTRLVMTTMIGMFPNMYEPKTLLLAELLVIIVIIIVNNVLQQQLCNIPTTTMQYFRGVEFTFTMELPFLSYGIARQPITSHMFYYSWS